MFRRIAPLLIVALLFTVPSAGKERAMFTVWETNEAPALDGTDQCDVIADRGLHIVRTTGELFFCDTSQSPAKWMAVPTVTTLADVDTVRTKSNPCHDPTHGDYGAVADDSNDDSAAINLALADIATAGGGCVCLPRGVFNIENPLTPVTTGSLCIVGQGANSTELRISANLATPMIKVQGTSGGPHIGEPIIANLKIGNPSRTYTGDAIYFEAVSGIRLQNLWVDRTNGYAFKCAECWDGTINDVHFQQCGNVADTESCVWNGPLDPNDAGTGSNNLRYEDVQVEAAYWRGMEWMEHTTKNYFHGKFHGQQPTPADYEHLYMDGASSNQVIGSNIGNGATTVASIRMVETGNGTCENNIIKGNSIRAYGLHGVHATDCDRAVIEGNTFGTNATTDDIWIDGGSGHVISGNVTEEASHIKTGTDDHVSEVHAGVVTILRTETGKPALRLELDPATPADFDTLDFQFRHEDDSGAIFTAVNVRSIATDVSNTTEDSDLVIDVMNDGSGSELFRLDGSAMSAKVSGTATVTTSPLTLGDGSTSGDVCIEFDQASASDASVCSEYNSGSEQIVIAALAAIFRGSTPGFLWDDTDSSVTGGEGQILLPVIDATGGDEDYHLDYYYTQAGAKDNFIRMGGNDNGTGVANDVWLRLYDGTGVGGSYVEIGYFGSDFDIHFDHSGNGEFEFEDDIYIDGQGSQAFLYVMNPDGNCSRCGADNSDVWSCSPVTCP